MYVQAMTITLRVIYNSYTKITWLSTSVIMVGVEYVYSDQ